LRMAAALPASLLADMTEQQQIDVACEVSRTAADAETGDANLLRAVRESRKDWLWEEARALNPALITSYLESVKCRAKRPADSESEVSIDEVATAAARKRRRTQSAGGAGGASARQRDPAPPKDSPRGRAVEAAEARLAMAVQRRIGSSRKGKRQRWS
jgi:hypothetical protein